MFTPRDYQLKAHELIVNGFKQGLKLLLLMSTGAGKSKTAISFIDKYKDHYIFIIVVRRRILVDQLEDDLKLFNLDYGVFMSMADKYDPKKSIQLCSIDTIGSRQFFPHLFSFKDIVLIVDEADESNADNYQNMIYQYVNRHKLTRPSNSTAEQMMTKIRPAFLLGMTATAFDSPLPHFDKVIEPITALELKNRKMLVDYIYFIPSLIDFSTYSVNRGEFNTKDVEKNFNTRSAIKDNFDKWLQFGKDRQTLIFCSSQDHAKNVCEYINNYYGFINAIAVDANTTLDIRKDAFDKFKKCIIKFIVNVRLITRGTDIPEIGTILDLAPTLSTNLHIQKLGRGSRPNRLYDDCIIIDIANNCVNNGHFYQKRAVNLTEVKRKNKADLISQMRVCSTCFRAAEPIDFGSKNTCPFCGASNGKVTEKKLSKAKEKALLLENASPEKIEQIKMINEFKKILWKYENLGKKYSKDISRENAHRDLIKKYGINKVEKIKNAIGLKADTIRRHKEIMDYVPLQTNRERSE